MKPSEVSNAIETRIKEQIHKSLPVHHAAPKLARQLEEFFQGAYPLSKSPYLEAVPAYQPAETLEDLAGAGVIAARTAEIFACYFLGHGNAAPAQVTLHAHQAEAIREVCKDGKNLVVCSGTGSGKTECFLIPLVDSLVREMEANGGSLEPGVRAMILYPMNALVNDQIRRLRNVLRWAPEITFGKFIGETVEDDRFVSDDIERIEQGLTQLPMNQNYHQFGFDDEGCLNNEVTTRAKFRAASAHILVTNYSMLERLLLQPVNSPLFGRHWRFIVLDEAHCYSGALGTEIAWLVRRVKRRVEQEGGGKDQLRFLATSATLISDENLTKEEKQQRIRDNFASRLFPAVPASFAVQFGTLADNALAESVGSNRSARDFVELVNRPYNGSTLMAESQDLLGRLSWRTSLLGQLGRLLSAEAGNVAMGDLLAVTASAWAASSEERVWSGLTESEGGAQGILDGGSEDAVRGLHRLLDDVIGGVNDRDSWRKWLHDESDPAPSSIPSDVDNQGRRRARGNRLYLLNVWQRPVTQWSWDALDWLLRIATEVAAATDTGVDPGALQVTMSDPCRHALQSLNDQLSKERDGDITLAGELDNQWADALGCEATGSLRLTLANALKSDPKLDELRTELRGANDAAGAERATDRALAATLFGADPEASAGLDALVALGTLAQEAGKRTPLLDVRYHQIIRGVSAPGLDLSCTQDGTISVTLLPDTTQKGLTLGLCRDCGQPFALGYAEGPELDQLGPHRLSPVKSRGTEYLHAFAWKETRGGAQQPAELWLNTSDGLVTLGGAPQDDFCVPVARHASPERDHREFIKKCPFCETDQRPMQNSKFGIITPYEASGDSIRMVAMEELARQAGASGDPIARKLPGEGRKLLVFSDSRIGSAGLALAFQEYHAETILEPLLHEAAIKAAEVPNPTDEQVLQDNIVPVENWDMYLEAPAFMQVERARWMQAHAHLSAFESVADSLVPLLKSHNLAGLLSVAEMDANLINPIGELPLEDAARWRLIQALCRSGRHSARRKGILRLSNSILENPDPQTLNDLGGVSPDVFAQVTDALISWCLDRVQVDLQQGYPLDGIQRYQKTVSRDGAPNAHTWETDSENSKLLRYLRTVICANTTYWRQPLRTVLEALAGGPDRQLAGRILEAEDAVFLKLVQDVCGAPNQDSAIEAFPGGIRRNSTDACVRRVAREIQNQLGAATLRWLEMLWPLFTQNPQNAQNLQSILTCCGNNEYRLNPKALLIFPGDGAPDADRELIPLRIEEHTAQLAKARGSDYQRAFALGKINILSCSTTFEMGVDLGDLSCVFLNGMPPSVANYRQRAGRAGRRPGSPSYVLTFLGDRDHDRYFWDHPEQLLFASLEEPRIYLDNAIYRARHLRAEAFHDFVRWLEDENLLVEPAATKCDVNGAPLPAAADKPRKWTTVGDLLVGLGVGRRTAGHCPVRWRFSPLVELLPRWVGERSEEVQRYTEGIDGIGTGQLQYEVAKDLVWQLKKQDLDEDAVRPFEFREDDSGLHYRLLGGPNWPEFGGEDVVPAEDVRRRSIQEQAMRFFPAEANQIEGFQRHLLGEKTITWLSRTRVLPKYGFPVDVINLMPHPGDPFGGNVKLERDLKVGIVEYAPGQVVVADKRRYRSEKAVVWQAGEFIGAGNALHQGLICEGCHEPSWGGKHGDPCRYCGDPLREVNLCYPEAFRAARSTPAGSRLGERGTPVHAHTRAFAANGLEVADTGLITKESESGTITYINQGPGFGGFSQDGVNFSLCHEVRTDIAGWMLSASLFQNGALLSQWAAEAFGGRRRLDAAMKSAMYALVRAVARVKQIEERDIKGILQPGDGVQGERGFVLFDDSTGGGGAVIDLVLCGIETVDRERSDLIRAILDHAIRDLEACPTCRAGAGERDFIPVTHDEWLGMNQNLRDGHRRAKSCYSCLRSHSNQRDHAVLDCEDAIRLIQAIAGGAVPA